MGKASRTKQGGGRQERIAAQRAAQRRREVRNRVLMISGAAALIIVIVVVFVVIKVNSKPPSSAGVSNGPTGAALAPVIADTTGVPAATLEKVGAGSVTSPPGKVAGTPLTSGGKPETLYIGAEYCPFCAFERWGMIVALSRFGSFSGLHTVHSSSIDVLPNTPTWSFDKSSYTSKYLAFSAVEETTNVVDKSAPGGYKPLQTPTAAQQALITKYDAPPYVSSQNANTIPFVYYGGAYLATGASVSTGSQLLDGKSWAAIASSLKNASSPIAQAVDGTANYMTAAICKLTGNQPAAVCTPTVTALQAKMPSAGG
jgi:hypothetical protein